MLRPASGNAPGWWQTLGRRRANRQRANRGEGLCRVYVLGTRNGCVLGRDCPAFGTWIPAVFSLWLFNLTMRSHHQALRSHRRREHARRGRADSYLSGLGITSMATKAPLESQPGNSGGWTDPNATYKTASSWDWGRVSKQPRFDAARPRHCLAGGNYSKGSGENGAYPAPPSVLVEAACRSAHRDADFSLCWRDPRK
jgi:hypothetical protein